MIPDADHLYACDKTWWQKHIEAVKRTFKGKLYTQYRNPKEAEFARENGIEALEGAHSSGLGKKVLHYGSNSGYQAINLAYLMGATDINLLGYDMGQTGGKNHWFGNHPNGLTNGNYESFIPRFDSLAADLVKEGVRVTNYTRVTKLNQFKRGNLDCIA
jgi:hypothetical protein